MKELQEKYADVILSVCLKIEKNQPLFISANSERLDFVRIIADKALELGVKDIYFDITDSRLKHSILKELSLEELKKHQFFNKGIWNEYAKKGAAFVMLASETPGLMKDIEPKKLSDITMYSLKTRKKFDDLRSESRVPWCIAAVPTDAWAKEIFPDSKDPLNDLWNKIFEVCALNEKDPESFWNKKTATLLKRSEKLTDYHFKKLIYTDKKGTNFTIKLPKNAIWVSGYEELANGKQVLVNYPTEEVFTSPDCKSASGIVYASKPLSYQDNMIRDFWIKFENGKAVDCHAEEGEETLRNIISSCKNSNMLGEVALVPYDSLISNSNIIFYETLFDENAACHLALGDSFPECILNKEKLSKKELFKQYNLNDCTNHVDFMIGNKDTNIIGITADNKEIPIFENGNFSKYFD